MLGPNFDTSSFFNRLNPRSLVDFASDFLWFSKHEEIRITDGPGDGERDIHSLILGKTPHITQSKFHFDSKKTVSSKELGELVLAMVKAGCRNGLFITNSKISPQAKRECLNSYPGYEIKFLDGRDLANVILGNTVLKAIWCDGQSFDSVSYKIMIPLAARDLANDRPIMLLGKFESSKDLGQQKVGQSNFNLLLQEGYFETSRFGAYRVPTIKTTRENGGEEIGCYQFIITGLILFKDLEEILIESLKLASSEILVKTKEKALSAAILLGKPLISPLTGKFEGTGIDINTFAPKTYILRNGNLIEEEDWWEPKTWFLPRRPGSSQASWIAWYSPRTDVCLNLKFSSPPTLDARSVLEDQIDSRREQWKSSIFALVPSSLVRNLSVEGIPEPDSVLEWIGQTTFLIWFHPQWHSNWLGRSVDSDDGASKIDLSFPGWLEANDRSKIQTWVDFSKGEFVTPHRARYMYAAIQGDDVLSAVEAVEYDLHELHYGNWTIPTPILPDRITMNFKVCWVFETNSIGGQIEAGFIDLVEKFDFSPFQLDPYLDENNHFGCTIFICEIFQSGCSYNHESIDANLGVAESELDKILKNFEGTLKGKYKVRRVTRKFWRDEIGLLFDCELNN
jgi:Restriction endonuclease